MVAKLFSLFSIFTKKYLNTNYLVISNLQTGPDLLSKIWTYGPDHYYQLFAKCVHNYRAYAGDMSFLILLGYPCVMSG